MTGARTMGRFPLMAIAMLALFAALWGGLLRLGWQPLALEPALAQAHGPLMVCGFLGTLICLERAVALGAWWAYAAPLLTGLGALTLIAGLPGEAGPALITLGSLGLVLNFAIIIRRQTALFTVTMGLGALAWLAGNCLWLAGVAIINLVFCWAGFLVLTILGERLELSRMLGPANRSHAMFLIAAGLYLAGLIAACLGLAAGMRLMGVGMIALTLWLALYDVARRTIAIPGLTRFIAVNLLAGYCWLGVSGVIWLLAATYTPARYDAMLHTLFLGFVFSMIFAHAPIIFPAVLGRPLRFSRAFYAHTVLLHLSLLLRVGGDLIDWFWAYEWGGMLNVLAVLLFVTVTVLAALAGARQLPISGLRTPGVTRG